MKKFIGIFVLSILCFAVSYAQNSFNDGQLAIRSSIMSYLRSEGYQPSIDEDGDIKFKRQGDFFFVIVSDTDSSPYYVKLTKPYSYGEKITKARISMFANEINNYKMIKLYARDNAYALVAEMYLTNADAFTSIMGKIMRIMDAAEEEIRDTFVN